MKRGEVKRVDSLTTAERSIQMSRVRAKGNRSTELSVAGCLARARISGWKRNPRNVFGKPDFLFRREAVALFVDGCFWHGCSKCNRNLPQNRREFWSRKIERNRVRDKEVAKELQRAGFQVVRVWEHEVRSREWLARLLMILEVRRDARVTHPRADERLLRPG